MGILTVKGSSARINFNFFIGDIDTLFSAHKELINRGRPRSGLGVFTRSALILLITAWETYIEDTITTQFNKCLLRAKSPSDMHGAFITTAQAWSNKNHKKLAGLQECAGDGWKLAVSEDFKKAIQFLNTPDAYHIRKICECYLDFDVTQYWRWGRKSANAVCSDLKEIIVLRGELAHRGPEVFSEGDVTMTRVKGARNLIQRIVQSTDKALGIAP